VLLPANGGDARDYAAVVPRLSGRFTVYAVDWPCFGAAARPGAPGAITAMALADLVIDLVRTLPEPALVVGNSVGGYSAVRAAIAEPTRVRSLLLVNSGGFSAHNVFTRTGCRLLGLPSVSRWAAGWLARANVHVRTEAASGIVSRARGISSDPAQAAAYAGVWRSFAHPAHDLRERARGVRAPARILWGKRDHVLRSGSDGENAARCLPGASFRLVDCGHAPHAELPDVFVEEIESCWSARREP
jgi:pimeloyl-ACP methyl ester carboxylesterase